MATDGQKPTAQELYVQRRRAERRDLLARSGREHIQYHRTVTGGTNTPRPVGKGRL